ICLTVAAAAFAIASMGLMMRGRMRAMRLRASLAIAAALAGAVLAAWGLASTVSGVPWQAIAYGRRVASILRGLDLSAEAQPLFVGEGINSSVVITDRGGQRFFYVSGKSEASSALLDMRL